MSDWGTILVTGGSGHLGANLVHKLIDEGYGGRLRCLVRPQSDNRALDGLPVERVEGDLRDASAMRRACKGIDRVFHVAARIATIRGGEQEIFDTNVLGTRNVLAAAKEAGVKKVVVTSSFSAVGYEPGRPSTENDPFNPFKKALPYEYTKSFAEMECWRAAAGGLPVTVATSCAIIGPHDYKPSRMGDVLLSLAHRKLPAYLGPGGYEFVASRDIVAGHLLAMEKGRVGEKYIFGSGSYDIGEILQWMSEVSGQPMPPIKLPMGVMSVVAHITSPIAALLFPNKIVKLTPDAVRLLRQRRAADTTKARTELGFQPTSMKAAIQEAYDDFVRRGLIVPKSGYVPAASLNGAPKNGAAHGAAKSVTLEVQP